MTNGSTELVHNLSFAWRVTRYDPAYRDPRGAYTIETWTSIGDVGRVFEGHVLSIEEYEGVESAYIDAFLSFAHEAGTESVHVREYSSSGGEQIEEGAIVPIGEATEIVRAMLREEVNCRLESPENDFYLHVGFDLYMYVGAANPCPKAVAHANEIGLFVDSDWPSPMLPDMEGE